MNTARSGRDREYKVRDDMSDHGWVFIMRAAASRGPADLLMAHPERGPALVQVGNHNKGLSPRERHRMLEAARLCRAVPVLARVVPRQGIEYTKMAEKLSEWEAWTPWTPGDERAGIEKAARRFDQ